jgi:acyl-CoA reductase-like NAD-dependent aldehyde dehydrogenase
MKASNYIAGQWVEGTGSFNNINPSDTSDQIDSYTSATAEQFEQAVQAAIKAHCSECHRKIDNLSEKRTKPTLDQ